MTIAYDVNNASEIIQDGAENADVRRNSLAEKVALKYHRNPKWVPQESQDYVLRSPNVERNYYPPSKRHMVGS